MKKQNMISTFILIGTLIFDQITKYWALISIQNKGIISIFGDFFIFQYAENTGAFLSMGAGLPENMRFWIFTFFVFFFLLYLSYHLYFKSHQILSSIALAFVLAGGIGNLIDRALRGKVIDFMNLGIGSLRTGIFNIADIAIVIGVSLLIFLPNNKDNSQPRIKS